MFLKTVSFYLLFHSLIGTLSADDTTGLDIKLISETSTIVSGQAFTVGLHIKHEEGFHTYWKNPGIVGVATSLEWQLPEGFKASNIQWPYPELTKMASHPCHGYERDVTLLVTITPPKKIASDTVTLHAKSTWMCCADTCYPGSKNLSITLPVAEKKSPDVEAVKLIRKARAEIPRASKAWQGAALTGRNEKSIRVKIHPPRDAKPKSVYLFSCDGQISSDKKQTLTVQPDGTWLLTTERCEFSPANPTQLEAVLKVGDQYILIYPKYPE